MKKLLNTFLICVLCLFSSGAVFKIDAERNAFFHNNKGVNYLEEENYYSAIKEFEIAIRLNPNTQATAVYYSNLGRTYMKIGYPKMAQPCFERAIIQNPLSFDYYLALVSAYKSLGLLDVKLKEYKAKKNDPMREIMLGLIYIEKGQVSTGVTTLDEFCNREPNLLITKAIKQHMKNKVYKCK